MTELAETTEAGERAFPEPAAERSTRRGRRRRTALAPKVDSRRLTRRVYFALASIWGFVTGSAAILMALSASGRPVQIDPLLGAILAVAAVLSVVGGIVAAAAYREAIGSRRGKG